MNDPADITPVNGNAVAELIARARAGDQAAWGTLLEQFRPYLRAIAQDELDSKLGRRVDASDVVQESLVDAHRDFPQFQGVVEAELVGWLRKVVQNNAIQAARFHRGAQRRSINRERFADESNAAGQKLASVFASEETSIGRRVVRQEESEGMLTALESLLVDQRTAVRLHYLDGWSVKQIAAYLGRTDAAVGGLIKRGLRRLREMLAKGEAG